MESEIFFIRSLYVQNAIMGTALGCVLLFLGHALLKKKRRNIVVFSIWLFLVFWFFNSPFFGFSAVTVGPGGIGLDYGILSFRNATLPLGSPWRIETHMGGIRRNKRLYYFIIDDHASMKVKGPEAHQLLQDIGSAIEDMRKKTGPEIESILQEHQAVIGACVVGIPDVKVGERIKAFVVLKEDVKGITGYDLIKWCRDRLVGYKVPQYIEFRDMLPKSKVGKLLRREVRSEEKRRAES